MQHTKYASQVSHYVINQDVILVHDQFAGTFHTPVATKFRVIGQSFSLLRKQFVKSCRRRRIIRFNIVEDSIPVRNRFKRPIQLHNNLSS